MNFDPTAGGSPRPRARSPPLRNDLLHALDATTIREALYPAHGGLRAELGTTGWVAVPVTRAGSPTADEAAGGWWTVVAWTWAGGLATALLGAPLLGLAVYSSARGTPPSVVALPLAVGPLLLALPLWAAIGARCRDPWAGAWAAGGAAGLGWGLSVGPAIGWMAQTPIWVALASGQVGRDFATEVAARGTANVLASTTISFWGLILVGAAAGAAGGGYRRGPTPAASVGMAWPAVLLPRLVLAALVTFSGLGSLGTSTQAHLAVALARLGAIAPTALALTATFASATALLARPGLGRRLLGLLYAVGGLTALGAWCFLVVVMFLDDSVAAVIGGLPLLSIPVGMAIGVLWRRPLQVPGWRALAGELAWSQTVTVPLLMGPGVLTVAWLLVMGMVGALNALGGQGDRPDVVANATQMLLYNLMPLAGLALLDPLFLVAIGGKGIFDRIPWSRDVPPLDQAPAQDATAACSKRTPIPRPPVL